MLERLANVLRVAGQLTGLIIDEHEGCPSSSAFRSRFGSLIRAYTLVGFNPPHDYRYLEINKAIRRLHPVIVQNVIDGLRAAGACVLQDVETDLLWIHREFTISIVISRCRQTTAGSFRWRVALDNELQPDLTIAVRMDRENSEPLDYYLLPRLDMATAVLCLCQYNGLSLDAYRCDDLDQLYDRARRCDLRLAA
jgi:hypothetical protein